jgi:hypothetical protein
MVAAAFLIGLRCLYAHATARIRHHKHLLSIDQREDWGAGQGAEG